MADKTEGVLDPLKCAVHCVREHRGPVRGAEMEQAVAKVAELLAADEEYDAAQQGYQKALTASRKLRPELFEAHQLVTASKARRAAAIRAVKGDVS